MDLINFNLKTLHKYGAKQDLHSHLSAMRMGHPTFKLTRSCDFAVTLLCIFSSFFSTLRRNCITNGNIFLPQSTIKSFF